MQEAIRKKNCIIISALFVWLVFSSFISQEFYAAATRYATLLIFICLALLFVGNVSVKEEWKRAPLELSVCVAGIIITGINLVILGSNKGAFFTAADLLLLLYLAPKLTLSDKAGRIMAGAVSLLMVWWYAFVRWEYNFNMAGLVFLSLMIFGELFLEYVKNDLELYYLKYVQLLLFLTTLLFTLCYHARSALVCTLLFGLVWGILPRLSGKKGYYALIGISTFGSLIFTGLYAAMARSGREFTFLYKDIYSGRQDIWAEIWAAFFSKPLTGIGSSWDIKSFFIFEIHNGLLDILAVHGILVFAGVLFLLLKRLSETGRVNFAWYPEKRIAAAGIYCYLFASFFENGFITAPYEVLFWVLLLTVLH
ncbi:MAG: hypothetical protein K5985_04405 [Lachnospiraceae bacterium]|nr:hypothetical protein [Lachnospiraceae bacterium]